MLKPADLTDEMIRSALDALPPDHYSRQWYADALGSEHPQRRGQRPPHRLRRHQRPRGCGQGEQVAMASGHRQLKICTACERERRRFWRVARFFKLWTCRKCESLCCEHRCTNKVKDAATCGTCMMPSRARKAGV